MKAELKIVLSWPRFKPYQLIKEGLKGEQVQRNFKLITFTVTFTLYTQNDSRRNYKFH